MNTPKFGMGRIVVWAGLSTAVLAVALLGACGGGGGGGGLPSASLTGASVGQMATGSVIVNGVRFDDSGATIEIENDATPSRGELRDGMIVEVEGTFNDDGLTGTATRVRFADTLEGPVTGLTTSPTGQIKTLSILGQQVRVEQGVTLFDNATGAVSFATLANGQVLEVSGLPDANGMIQATFIQTKPAGGVLEVKGTIDAINSATSFTINGLTVTHAGVTVVGTLAANALVEVKGTQFDAATTTLTATSVEVGTGRGDAAKVEVEGFLRSLSTTAKTFTVNGQLVNYGAAQFLGGLEADLIDGLKIEAEGPIAAGTLNAVKVRFKESLRFEANVATVDPVTGTLQLAGFPNLQVQTDALLTQFKDGQALGSFANTAVKLRGRPSGNAFMVTRLEQTNASPQSRTIVQGPVTAFDAATNSVTLFGGITVSTSTINDITHPSGSNFEIEDVKVSKATFFASLKNGEIVKARANVGTANALTWDQIEIEVEDD